MRRCSLALLGAVLLLATSCSSDPTSSEEYVALEAERDDLAGQLESVEAERDEVAAEASALQEEVAAQQSEIESLQDENESLTETVNDVEAELTAQTELAAVWPQEMKDAFVEGCVGDPGEGVTAEEAAELCYCMIDEMEKELTLSEFFSYSLAVADPNAELNPITGFPTDMPDDMAEAIVQAMSACIF